MSWLGAMYRDFLLATAGPLLIFLLISYAYGKIKKQTTNDYLQIGLLLVGVVIVGACAGYAGGMSREPAVGAIIPAMFTLLGLLAVYLFGVDSSKGVIASITGGAFALSLFVAYASGSTLRNTFDEYRDVRQKCAAAYATPEIIMSEETVERFEARMMGNCQLHMGWNSTAP